MTPLAVLDPKAERARRRLIQAYIRWQFRLWEAKTKTEAYEAEGCMETLRGMLGLSHIGIILDHLRWKTAQRATSAQEN
jgi:hypothetical protein